MAVYVDEMSPCMPNKNWPWNYACHLVADTIDELHLFASKIGLQRAWFQDNSRLPHYDLTFGMRKRAVNLGAIEVDRNKIFEMMQKNKGDICRT